MQKTKDIAEWLAFRIAQLSYVLAVAAPILNCVYIMAYMKTDYCYVGWQAKMVTYLMYAVAPVAVGLAIVALILMLSTANKHGHNFASAAIVVGLSASLIVFADVYEVQNIATENQGRSCVSTLEKLANSIQLYCNDYDGTLPSSYLYGHSKQWNKRDFINYAKRRGDLTDSPSKSKQSWPMLLYPYLKDDKLFWCPSDRSRNDNPDARVSYYWKAAIDRAWYGGFQKTSDFPYPSNQFILYERRVWHRYERNCICLDSHIRAFVLPGKIFTKKPAEPLPKSGVGEPAWFSVPANQIRKGGTPVQTKDGAYWNPKKWVDSRYW